MDPKPEAPDEEVVGENDLLEVMSVQRSQSAPSAAPLTAGRIRSKICDVRGCTSNSLRNPELLFVAVPGQNAPERRFVWLTLMQAIRDKKRSYVCSRHFAVPDDFKDFEEYISAPPGYKRQLLVKRGVVPHFNMPPLNMPGLPPLNDRWQLTLPVGMTETDQLRQARVTAMFSGGVGHLQGPTETSVVSSNRPAVVANQQTSAVQRAVKAVQTETVFSSGQRKMQPSLQYCRLCLQRQDLEPIFTGDQTLIEPDLIDKIYGCTQILITIENDFPSSICTSCYQNVQHFITFRRSVQKNDQSLRSTAAAVGTFKPAPCPPLPAPVTARSSPSITQPLRTKTVGKVTPMRPVPSMAAPIRNTLASPQCPGIVPLAPWTTSRTPPAGQQEQRQPEHRTYAPQRTVIRQLPIGQNSPKETSGNQSDIDPFANVEESSSSGWDNQQEGIQMGDCVVPVTLIRVQPEQEAAEESEEEEEDVVEVPEEPEKKPEEDNSRRNFLQPKPLEKLLENARKTAPESKEPEVLQAVELIPSAVAQEVVKQQKAPKIFLRKAPAPSKRLGPVPTLSKVKEAPKFSTIPKVVRGVKFPGTLTTLFSGTRKPSKVTPKMTKSTASPELTKYKAVSSPKPSESPKPESPAPEKPKTAPPSKPKAPTPTAQVLKEVKVPEETTKESPRPKPPPPSTKPKQKENDIPESPKSDPDLTSPRSARARKIPAKFQDTIGFPMPKVVIKSDPDAPAKELPEAKSASDLPELRVRVQDARTRLSVGKPEVSPAPKTRLSGGKPQTPSVTKEPGKKVQAAKVLKPMVTKEPEKKVQATKVQTPTVSKEPERKIQPARIQTASKEPEKKVNKAQTPAVAKEPERKIQATKVKPKEPAKIVPKANEAKSTPVQQTKSKEVARKTPSVQIAVKLKDSRGRLSKEASPQEPAARPTKRKSVPDEKESPRAKRTSLETPKAPKPNGSRQSAPAKPSPAPAPATPAAVAPRASACPFCSNRTFEDKKALVKHLRKRHGMDYATVRQRLAIYGGNW